MDGGYVLEKAELGKQSRCGRRVARGREGQVEKDEEPEEAEHSATLPGRFAQGGPGACASPLTPEPSPAAQPGFSQGHHGLGSEQAEGRGKCGQGCCSWSKSCRRRELRPSDRLCYWLAPVLKTHR